MSKIVKGALVGAALGVGITVVKAYRRDEPVDVLAAKAAKAGAGAAVAGAALGWVWAARGAGHAEVVQSTAALARAVGPAAVELLSNATDAALPYVERAVDQARPHVERAAEVAREHAEHAVKVTAEQAERAARRAQVETAGGGQAGQGGDGGGRPASRPTRPGPTWSG